MTDTPTEPTPDAEQDDTGEWPAPQPDPDTEPTGHPTEPDAAPES